MALIDLDYFLRHPLGARGVKTLDSDIVQENIDTASDYVEDELDRKIASAEYTERVVGQGDYILIVNQYPITDLSDITWDGYPGDVGTVSASEFLIHANAGMIEWIDKRNYFRTDRIYTVTYTAGYEIIPNPIKQAVVLQTVQLMRPMFGGPSGSTIELDQVVPFADEMIVNLLERYRRKRIA